MKPQSLLALLLAIVLPVSSQVPGIPLPPPPPGSQNNLNRQTRPTFSLTMSQTIVNVSVTDRSGKPVEHLTKDDFEVYEDGKLQTLQACEFEHLGTAPLPSLHSCRAICATRAGAALRPCSKSSAAKSSRSASWQNFRTTASS